MLKEIIFNHFNVYKWLKKNQPCLLCEDETQHLRGWLFCSLCLADLPWLTKTCVQCGINMATRDDKCAGCTRLPPSFDRTITLFSYEWPISQMLIQYKYQGKLYYLPTFSDMLALKIMASYKKSQCNLPDLILPVPLSIPRLKQRGFNQALELAKSLSKKLGVPYHVNTMTRIRDTPRQAGLSLKQRRANLNHAFTLDSRGNKISRFIKNKRIVLVDDVLTTGSTLEALAKLLKEAGARSVENWVLARTLAKIS